MKVKVCGLTHLDDTLRAAEAGADYLGFVLYPPSPRFLPPRQVARLAGVLETRGVPARRVGVFVDVPAEQVLALLEDCGLHLAQLHGRERLQDLERLQGRAYKALRGPHREGEPQPMAYAGLAPRQGPDLLLDAYHPTLPGGTGLRADWSLAASLAARCRLLLAGGLTPENVAEAVRRVRPWGVDVASGVEGAPGRKDPRRLEAFVRAARTAAQEVVA